MKTEITKTDITKRLKAFEKLGLKLYTFNSHRAMPIATKGWPDHVLMGRGWIFFIECKFGYDKISDAQADFLVLMNDISYYNRRVMYFTLHDKNAELIFTLISKELSKKK